MRLPVISEYASAESLSSLLVNHLTSRDVSDVMINGEFYLAKGEVMTMAEEEIVAGFRATHAMFFGSDAKKPPQPPRLEVDVAVPPPTLKILPFTNVGRASRPPNEGFESGFRIAEKPRTVIERKPDTINAQPPAVATPPKDAPRTKQNPSKESWLTFGEDEDF
jgi:hypothetical protein